MYVREDGSQLMARAAGAGGTGPDGVEKSRAEFVDVEATVRGGLPVVWTGRLIPLDEALRKFVFTRACSCATERADL